MKKSTIQIKKVLEFISQNGGSTKEQIMEAVGLTRGQVTHHLMFLKEKVKTVHIAGQRRGRKGSYYLTDEEVPLTTPESMPAGARLVCPGELARKNGYTSPELRRAEHSGIRSCMDF